MTMREAWIDVGGTFTDCLLHTPGGTLKSHKLLSSGTYKRKCLAPGGASQLILAGDHETPPGYFKHATARWGEVSSRVTAQEGSGTESLTLQLADDVAAPPEGSLIELAFDHPAPIAGIRWMLGLDADAPIPPLVLRLGTTRATNALLEAKGARVALITTLGFGDVQQIGYQERPKLFALHIERPQPLCEMVIEANERLTVDGHILTALDEEKLLAALRTARDQGISSIAIALLHATRNPCHERRIAELARSVGFAFISLSSEVAAEPRFIARVESTVADAYLTPVLRTYLEAIAAHLPGSQLQLMTSGGGLIPFPAARGLDAILSGPAGGAVGVARVADIAGEELVLGFDMGGTSTDVCRVAHAALDRRYLTEHKDERTGGIRRLLAPTVAVETVAAGGGSICRFDGSQLLVGPESAGASPGPACYGRGGPLTVTDVAVVLGRVPVDRFAFPLDVAAARTRLAELAADVGQATGDTPRLETLAEQLLTVAASAMAEAIRRVSLAKGHDPREHALVSFGGAGAQHACQVASLLGVRRIVQHPLASLLSAYGCGIAPVERELARPIGRPAASALTDVAASFTALEKEARLALAEDGAIDGGEARTIRSLDLRYLGQDAALTLAEPALAKSARLQGLAHDELAAWTKAFHERHHEHFGFAHESRAVEVCTARLRLSCPRPAPRLADRRLIAAEGRCTRAVFSGQWRDVPLLASEELPLDERYFGPAILTGDGTTIVVMPGWYARRLASGLIELVHDVEASQEVTQRQAGQIAAPPADASAAASDVPMRLSLYAHRLTSIAERMGHALRQSALSVNIKERLDFSCALFDAEGRLIVNAPHVPVHLGAMGETVRHLIAQRRGRMQEGDAYVTNDPYAGGSHLPDITVITPVFAPNEERSEPLFYAANRAHHAEIGGILPGSMPPFAEKMSQEGILIPLMPLVQGGRHYEAEMRSLLQSGPWPSRDPDTNLADLDAQLAANRLGRKLLAELMVERGVAETLTFTKLLQEAARSKTAAALAKLSEGTRRHADAMDDGTPVVVSVTITHEQDGGRAAIDFTGTGAPSQGNINANPAIVRAAVLYVLRCLVAEDLPLNEGVLDRVDLEIPRPSLLAPGDDMSTQDRPAVALGNVETSQRLCDVLLAAFGLCAASQGTMNNLLFGPADPQRPSFSHYETICGGVGAGPGFSGAHAVQSHMTNTRTTDPEVMEQRFPVRVRGFGLRQGSGGMGKWPGGCGAIRRLEALEPLLVSLCCGRRTRSPFGLAGGGDGLAGQNRLVRVDGSVETLPGFTSLRLEAGEMLVIETPGGGGYGASAAP